MQTGVVCLYVSLYYTCSRLPDDDGYRDIAEIRLQAWENLATVGTKIDEVAFDCGVAHGLEGIAVVQHLVDVLGLGLAGFVVNDPYAFWGENNSVGSDYFVVPGYVAFVFGREFRVEEACHFGLLHHVVERLFEGCCSVVVGTGAAAVGVEGVVGVIGAVDE